VEPTRPEIAWRYFGPGAAAVELAVASGPMRAPGAAQARPGGEGGAPSW
jgi:hypothetical protein